MPRGSIVGEGRMDIPAFEEWLPAMAGDANDHFLFLRLQGYLALSYALPPVLGRITSCR